MGNANFKYYTIDLGDIWEYERDQFLTGGSDEILAQKILDLAQQCIIKRGQPSFGKETLSIDSKYYDRNVFDYINADLMKKYLLEYFINKFNCYEYNQCILITKIEDEYDFFFALKLRQYSDDLFKVHDFLRYHLINTYSNEVRSFIKYLSISIHQYDYLFKKGLKKQVKEFISKLENADADNSTFDNIVHDKSDQIVKIKSKGLSGKKNKITAQKSKIWSGTNEQLDILFKFANNNLFRKISQKEFRNHFTGKTYYNKIDWIAGDKAFIELFDNLATIKVINQLLIKANNQFENKKLVIILSEIVDHFVFNGKEKTSSALNNVRSQIYTSSLKSKHINSIHELIEKMNN